MINFILIAIFLSLGTLSKKRQWLPDSASFRLNQFVVYICLPAIVLVKIPQLSLEANLLVPTLLPWGLVIVMSAIVLGLARWQNWSRSVTGCALMVCCFGNTSFFGFPMVKAFFGETGLPYAVVFDVLGSFLSLSLIGNLILAIFSGEGSFRLKSTLIRVLTFPPFVAIIVAWLIRDWRYPDWLETGLTGIGYLLVPSTMFLVGLHLSFRVAQPVYKPLQFVIVAKLIVMPLLAFLLLQIAVPTAMLNSQVVQVSIFEAAMPPMVTASVLAIHARLEPQLAAAAVGIGLFCSCLTLPVWYLVIS